MKKLITMVFGLSLLALPDAAFGQAESAGASRAVAVNGISLHYQERGAGEPVLLLHGFGMCGSNSWAGIPDELAKSYRVILPDLRGHGRSTNPSGRFTMRQSAEDIRALLDALGIRKVRAMGISAGGMTLLHLATKYPDRVSAMVVIGATTYFPEQARRSVRDSASRGFPKAAQDAFRQCASRGEEQVRELQGQFLGFKDSYEDMNLTPPYLATIKARTLIVHGDRDVYFPVAIPVEMYNSIPNAELWIVPGGDHVPIYGEREAEFLRIARKFLSGADGTMPEAK